MNELQAFEKHLRENEKSPATIEKYLRDARAFLCWLDGREPTKELTVCYKEGLTERYEAASVNSMLAGINSYLSFSGRTDCRVKPLRVQADDRIDLLFIDIVIGKRGGSDIGHCTFMLHAGDVEIMAVVRVAGRKMPMVCGQLQIVCFSGFDDH